MARAGQLSGASFALLLLCALFGLGASYEASAQVRTCTSASPRVCDEGQANSEAWAWARAKVREGFATPCVVPGQGSFTAFAAAISCTTGNRTGTESFYYGGSCANRPTYTGPGPWSSSGTVRNGSLGCQNGCDGMWFNGNGAGGMSTWMPTGGICPEDEKKNCDAMGDGYYWNALLKVCEPPEGECPGGGKQNSLGQCAPEPCPAGKVQQADGTCKNKDNECPVGNIKSPDGKCLPGDGQCAAGEVRGKDGTCKKDADGDGEPDPGEEGEGPNGELADDFSGGDSCNEPPSCSGSPIMCGQARIQWRIDCNTRKNRNIAGGTCGSMPVCTGEKCDALEYSSLLMQWRTACATEKALTLANNGGSEGGQPDWTKVGSMSQDPGVGASPDDTKVLSVKKLSVDDLDQSGIGGGGGGCIGFAASGGTGMGAGFAQAMASPPAFFCTYIGVLKAICILGASVVSVMILVSGGKS